MSSARWLLFLTQSSPHIEDFFHDINIPFDCEFFVVSKEFGYQVVLTEVYRVSSSLPLQVYRLGKLNSPSDQNLYTRRSNLQGLVLRSVIQKTVSDYCETHLQHCTTNSQMCSTSRTLPYVWNI